MLKGQKMKRTFHDNLILNRYLLSLFNQDNLEKFKQRLGDDRFEGIDNDGQTKFFHELTGGQLFQTDLISANDLRRYDLNIVKHWQQITENRNKAEGHILNLKYFQYLSLLFTEIYLDFYFNRPNELLNQLNEQLALLKDNDKNFPNFDLYELSDLNKLAFWNATGSGKTLLMHVNILQYQHYQKNKDLTVFVITPNDGLSQQHLAEFSASNLPANLFDKNKPFQGTGLFNDIQIMDINKLADKDGELTVAVDRFLDLNKLVLVDEGHRGSSGDQWLARRQKLIGDGFAFEYSATFGQAVKDGKTVKDCLFDIQKKIGKENGITKKADVQKIPTSFTDKQEAKQKAVFETYAKCVLFDYSYKFFYADGYGKEFSILNMKADDYGVADNDRKYFVASLLSFYQQLYLFAKNQEKLTAYNLHKPLWVFVGNTVNKEDSDIWAVVEQLAYFLDGKNRPQILAWLNDLLCDEPLLLDSKGNAIFRHRFLPLASFKGDLDRLYKDILQRLFNSGSSQHLYLYDLKKASGEIALSIDNDLKKSFALINVGDSNELLKSAVELDNVSVQQDEFSEGLFGTINQDSSTLNLLIGSRKFTEGWSSWRVSTMGLLNMGRGEGSQIIQLFGRGVRLKGRDFSLRRTPINQMPKGLGLDKLETLNIFGIKADYMAKFREYLEDEGIQSPDEVLQLDFPVQKKLPTNVALKTLRLKDGYKDNQKMGFKRQEMVQLYELPEFAQGKIKPILAVLDLYPRLEALSSKAVRQSESDERQSNKFQREIFALFDWDKLYLDLQQYKMERTWSNLRVSRDGLRKFVESRDDWYLLYVPDSAMQIRSFADIQTQQDILFQLLKEYTEQFYRRLKNAYEQQFMETAIITEENGSFFETYKMLFGEEENLPYGREQAVKKIEELADLIRDKKIEQAMNWQSPLSEFKAICFNSHLFYPLLSFDKSTGLPIKISPLPLAAESEMQFIDDLMQAEKSGELAQWLGGKSLYLMRNADRKDKGLGFALAGNFYPDFLLWVVDHASGKQWLNFVDPKGIRNMDLHDPKFGLYQEVKALEAKIADPNLVLNSFILSITKLQDWVNMTLTAEELAERHILFMENNYLQQMLEKMQ
ncbi:DEAD/DEAH box helicase family protein [Actinobacillus pleuropneumoniae]|uniref:DEAD/DEAH box helicase family protein n=1 Tax=Actinobacillus pleuropneumoniae TaxID=715 RepID=UPI001F329422|nr:DEAD/DEAH box helicase family protein [Actinobacillus pleuropneumoniae]UKH28446.1 type III restriction endonuclease subunit R [Actinobacillus pleuropneumoniae]